MAESFPRADSPEPAPIPTVEEIAPESQPEGRARRFRKRALRWLLGFLIVFGLGALLAVYALYLPARERIRSSQDQLEAANQKITELESRVDSLSGLETTNQELQAEIEATSLHVNILKARADIAAAQLSLAKDDPSKARLALSKTPNTLEILAGIIPPGQKEVVTDLQDRLKLAVSEIGENTFAADSDLNVLATGLMELENSYFTSP
jgi:cytoskeletal protein RodZ